MCRLFRWENGETRCRVCLLTRNLVYVHDICQFVWAVLLFIVPDGVCMFVRTYLCVRLSEKMTAMRETQEEIGLQLDKPGAEYLGQYVYINA